MSLKSEDVPRNVAFLVAQRGGFKSTYLQQFSKSVDRNKKLIFTGNVQLHDLQKTISYDRHIEFVYVDEVHPDYLRHVLHVAQEFPQVKFLIAVNINEFFKL